MEEAAARGVFSRGATRKGRARAGFAALRAGGRLAVKRRATLQGAWGSNGKGTGSPFAGDKERVPFPPASPFPPLFLSSYIYICIYKLTLTSTSLQGLEKELWVITAAPPWPRDSSLPGPTSHAPEPRPPSAARKPSWAPKNPLLLCRRSRIRRLRFFRPSLFSACFAAEPPQIEAGGSWTDRSHIQPERGGVGGL